MRSHRAILAAEFKRQKITHKMIAAHMGWKTPSTAGHKLRGRNDWESGELERMAELAGMSLVVLAERSDDLHLAKRKEAVEGAAILDQLSDDDLKLAMAGLRAYRDRIDDR